mmetsp:Transcript_110754/g.320004  ORF Transcript_110754/g.320004 Transcript_110754/m.320004 type:complete len:244 (+) Transcript_110754:644-1375(+)
MELGYGSQDLPQEFSARPIRQGPGVRQELVQVASLNSLHDHVVAALVLAHFENPRSARAFRKIHDQLCIPAPRLLLHAVAERCDLATNLYHHAQAIGMSGREADLHVRIRRRHHLCTQRVLPEDAHVPHNGAALPHICGLQGDDAAGDIHRLICIVLAKAASSRQRWRRRATVDLDLHRARVLGQVQGQRMTAQLPQLLRNFLRPRLRRDRSLMPHVARRQHGDSRHGSVHLDGIGSAELGDR